MNLYNVIIHPFVKNMDRERASKIALKYFAAIGKIPFGRAINRWIHDNRAKGLQKEVFGLSFYNPIGLGAGLDRYGELYNDLNNLGFSFVEVGPMDAHGISRAIENIQKDPQDDILAVCICKDYFNAFTLGYDFFDFFVLDIHDAQTCTDILDSVLEARIAEQTYKPIILKVPDTVTCSELESLSDYCLINNVDGMELRSIEHIRIVSRHCKNKLPIIANCHIDTPEKAREALIEGADLVEIRTGLLREGPGIVTQTLDYLLKTSRQQSTTNGSTI